MELQVAFVILTLSLCLYLTPREITGEVTYVPLPDDQCTEWKELTKPNYMKQINAPVKRIGDVATNEPDDSSKCKASDETSEIREPCTCMESVGLDPKRVNKYKKLDVAKPHHEHREANASESIEYDDSSEFDKKKPEKRQKADVKTPQGSFSEEFSGSEELLKPSGSKHKDADKQKGKDQGKDQNEDFADSDTEDGKTALEKSASYSYEDSQAGSFEGETFGHLPK